MIKTAVLLLVIVLILCSSVTFSKTEEIVFPHDIKFGDSLEEVQKKVKIEDEVPGYLEWCRSCGADCEWWITTESETIAGYQYSDFLYEFSMEDGNLILVQVVYLLDIGDTYNKGGKEFPRIAAQLIKKYANENSIGYYDNIPENDFAEFNTKKLGIPAGFIRGEKFILKGGACLEAESERNGSRLPYIELPYAYVSEEYNVKIELYRTSDFNKVYNPMICYLRYTDKDVEEAMKKDMELKDFFTNDL